ncbi:hypothetical protein PTTG_06528 [Puccinia triticina 1-1 BBBD Race 1]|uniref:Uncharacterized protein n=1 Tax=Puccinia triticina (isolate 1-1 / race 1 (BBBD)) TaxID=630390 RepID=A0A180GGT6_PUCT1|nr:hypothetical protein PTTG_06528 [Puccinia triticina 1-1 BBBD Race 1]
MTGAVSLCHLPSSFDYPAPSYPSHLQPTTLTELETRGQTPSGFDGRSQFPVEEAGLTREASPDISPHTVHVISNSLGSSSSSQASSPQPLRCITVAPLSASPRGGSHEIPAHLGSPVALTDPERSAAGLSFPLLCSSPIQESFDRAVERPLASNRRSRWLSTGIRSPAIEELSLEFESMEHPVSAMPGFKGHHVSKSTNPTTGSRSKPGDISSKLRSTMFASMNKSEPNLANPGCATSLSIAPAHDIPPSARTSGHPKNIRPNQDLNLSLSSEKTSPHEVAEMPRSLHTGYHPSIRSIFNQTSKRISEFTSRLNGPSTPSQDSLHTRPPPTEPLPPTPRLPVISSESNDIPESVSRVTLALLQRTAHHQEDLPVICQTLPPADNPPMFNKVKRSNARVHSPNFYQSLKSRWKPDILPAQDLFATISSNSSTSRSPPKTHLGEFQTPEISEVSSFAEPSPSRLATEIAEGSSEEKFVARSTYDSNSIGEHSSRTVQVASPSRLRAFSTSSRKITQSESSSNSLECSVVIPSPLNTIDQVKAPTTEVSKPEPMTIAEGSNEIHCSVSAPPPLSTSDQVKAPTAEIKPEPMTIAEGLHHKHHLNFAARRSSISMVLKRPDSLDASTPAIFQGIWEKELEENERKWKRLARISGSQSSSRYSTESYTEHDNASKTHGERAPFINGGSLRNSSKITSEHLIRLGRKLSQNKAAHHTKSQSQTDVLDQVWDSFKCEAELSLSDISCDRSIVDGASGSPECQSDLPALHQITFNDHFQRVHTVQDSESLARKDAKPIGLGLFHPCDPPIEGAFPIQDEYSPINNAKLKKLSLIAMRDASGAPASLPGRRRRPVNIISPEITDTEPLETHRASLDLSLLDAFPVPPRSHRSSQSSSSSHSLKPLKSTELIKSRRDGTATHTAPPLAAPNARPSPPPKDPRSHQRQKSTTENSKKNHISFTLTSFSNRPRAQTSVRSPVPPPLNLKASPSPNLNHRRRTMTSHVSNHSHSGPQAIPPVPFLHVPNTAPLVSTTAMSHDRDRAVAAAVLSPDVTRPSFPSEAKNSKAGTGGMTPKRPSLLIRPSLRSPHRAGIRPFLTGETSRSPKVPAPFSPSVPSPTTRGFAHTIQQSANSLQHSIEQATYFSSPHASVGSSTGTASSSSTVPSPATPTSLRMTYNSRIPSVPMYHASNNSPSGLKSPIKSPHPDNPRYVMIDQTPKYSGGARGAPDTIKASRVYRPELLNPLSEPTEQVSYGMAL